MDAVMSLVLVYLWAGVATVISVTGAGWDPLQFRNSAQPYFLRVMSGAAVGRTVLIMTDRTEHTATSVVVNNQGVALVDIAADDRFEIFRGDTLGTFFADMVASNAVLKNTAFSQADFVQIHNGSIWTTYFHNGTRWRPQSLDTNANNTVIRPDTAIVYGRRGASPINFTALGRVPSTALKVVVRNSGVTVLGNLFPVDRTLSAIGYQTKPGWVSASSLASADKVQIHNGTLWQTFYHNTQWLLSGLPSNPNVPATRPMVLVKTGSATGSTAIDFGLPYTL